jgi:ABC-type sugar transport system substrate-binding protein
MAVAALCVSVASVGVVSMGSAGASTGVTNKQLEKTVATVLGESYPISKLPPAVKQALTTASIPLTKAQAKKAIQCWKATSCKLGSGKYTIAMDTGYYVNTWRAFAKMNVIIQALHYPNIGKFIFTDAKGSLSTFESNIRETVAQGAKMIVGYNTFGPAAYPAFKAAIKAGAYVSTFVDPSTTATATELSIRVQPTICEEGKLMAADVKKVIGADGPVAYMTGVAGNTEDAGWQKCSTATGIQSVFNATTTWTPAGGGKAASALIASGKTVKAIMYSYSTPVPNIVQAYLTAKKQIPMIISFTYNNSTACLLKTNTFPLYLSNALNWAARVSVTALVNKVEKKKQAEAVYYPMPFFKVTKTMCTSSAPGGYPGTTALVPASLSQQMLAATG